MAALAVTDKAIERLKNARDNGAVLKLGLIQVRSRCPGLPIFVVEGVDDKSVYNQWVRRLHNDLRHEYYVCAGKRQVLMLHDSVRRDRNELSKKIYFFIDRDFDDYAGHEKSDSLFMTDMYAVENYLVCSHVLDDILSIELHCNGNPELRKKIKEIFDVAYGQFLAVTKEFNFRLFVAKSMQIARVGSFPERINKIAVVSLDKVEHQVGVPEEVIGLTREPTLQEVETARQVFEGLEPTTRYRGKFALMFFHRWLDLLADDHAAKNTVLFSEIEEKARARRNEIVLASLASRSPMPAGLVQFLASVQCDPLAAC